MDRTLLTLTTSLVDRHLLRRLALQVVPQETAASKREDRTPAIAAAALEEVSNSDGAAAGLVEVSRSDGTNS